MNTSQHKVLKQNQSIDIPNGTNSPSLSASLSSMRISGDLGTPQIENQNNAVQNNNSQVPNATQSNFEEHILLYNVLQQLTRKVQERDQLNEVLEQENVKLKYMLMTALNYCYDTIGNTQQKNEGANNFEYPRRNSNTDPNYSSSRMNVSSSNNSSRKGSTDDHQSSPRPDSRRDSQGMNISPRQQAEMMGMPIAQESSPQYDMLSSRRRSSNTVNTNPQYQQLETYVMGRKPSVEYHEPPQQQPSYEMPTHPERRRLSNNTSYGLENYVMPTTPQRSSQPQMQPQQQQDVYGDLQNYVMKKANPHAYQPAMPEVYHDEPIPSPAPRRSSAVPLENYVMPTSTSAQQSPYHNLDNYVMGGVQPQIQPQEPYRRSSVQVPQYIPSPTTHQQQSIPQQWQQQQQHPMDHQSQPYQVKERKRSTSNGTDYPLENYPTARPHVYTPKTPVPQQEKFFNMNDQYRRASLAFPPSSRHNQRQMGEPVQRSVDMFNENFMFPQQQQQQQQQQPPKRMSNPVYMHENFVFPQQQPPMDFANYRMTSANDYSPKVTSKKKKDRGDERRQSYGSQQQQQLQPSMPQQPYGSQQPPQQQQLQTPPPQSQLTSPDKVFGGDASVIPARRSSVIYTPGPSPKELRQQQQQKEKERQQQLLQQQQQKQEEKVDSVSTVEDCETYVSDDVSPVGNGQQQNQIVDDNASFVTYFSDSD